MTRDGRVIGMLEDESQQIDATSLAAPQIRVVLNWFDELSWKVPLH
jgi:hypothetical protein